MASVVVSRGDCISSIAAASALSADSVWTENAALAERRDNPNVLDIGDVVEVPEHEPRAEPCTTDRRHHFRVRAAPTLVRLKILRADLQPRAGLAYTLTIDGGEVRNGSTDDQGLLEEPIPPMTAEVTIAFEENDNPESYRIPLGTVRPVETTEGVQQRLLNLGFDCGEVDGVWGRRSAAAMREYQAMRSPDLRVTGQADDASRADLVATHGC